jgi:hypothetical protein
VVDRKKADYSNDELGTATIVARRSRGMSVGFS